MGVLTGLVPLVSVITMGVVSVATARFQRRTDELANVWKERAQLYVELLAHQDAYLTLEAEQHTALTDEQRVFRQELYARVAAFASPQVAAEWQVVVEAERVWRIGENQEPGMAGKEMPEELVGLSRMARNTAVSSLLNCIRKELITDRLSNRGNRLALQRLLVK